MSKIGNLLEQLMGYEKRKTTPVMECRHCGNRAPFKVVAEFNEVNNFSAAADEHICEKGPVWELLSCHSCKNISLSSYYYSNDTYSYNQKVFKIVPHCKILYPTEDNVPDGLPEPIHQSYKEALKVKHVSSNAFGVLLGRIIEQVCLDKHAAGDTFYEMIKYLSEIGEIPDKLVQVAHRIRKLRNIGAHAGLGDLTESEIPALHALCDAILTYIYTTPNMIDDVERRLEKLQRG